MDAIVERACGLDVHRSSIMACILVGGADRRPKKVVRSFGAFLPDLAQLRDWLLAEGCTHVGMESTGIYWRPVYRVLEGHFELIVGNAHHMKNVPGRKTDVKDAEWIADLVRHGLVAKSFVPPKPIQELRDLMRYRKKLIETRATERNRIIKLLETANVKLSSVASNTFGKSGMLMLTALANGEASADAMSEMALGRMRGKRVKLVAALSGKLDEHHTFLLKLGLERLRSVDRDIATLDKFAERRLKPYRVARELLQTIPGVGATTAATILSEMGSDMTQFRDAHHLTAWAGVAPGNNESGGRARHAAARKGNRTLRTALVEAAQGAMRKRDSYLRAKFYSVKARRGGRCALVAVARKILIAAYHVLRDQRVFTDLGGDYLDKLPGRRSVAQLIRRLERLGMRVTAEPSAANPMNSQTNDGPTAVTG